MDSLASANDILSTRDHILPLTGRLGHDYESFIVQITSNLNAYKLTDVITLLLTYEK